MTPLAIPLMTATLRPRLMSMTQLATLKANDNILNSIGLKIENILNELFIIQYIELLYARLVNDRYFYIHLYLN